MSGTRDQVKPLAPAVLRGLDIDVQPPTAATTTVNSIPLNSHRNCCIKCCGCSAAVVLIVASVVLILAFTVFRIKEPVLKMDPGTVQGLDHVIGNNPNTRTGLNLTLKVDVSIKNPNAASFRFSNMTTFVYYDGSLVGESRSLTGGARARRTVRLNVTVDVKVGRIQATGRLKSDLNRGLLPISSYTTISGKVKIVEVIKRHFSVKMNCTMNVNISRHGVQDRNCHY